LSVINNTSNIITVLCLSDGDAEADV